MKILITAPNLNPKQNVSGVSTVARTIIDYNKEHAYYHYLLGRPDRPLSKINWFIQLVKQILFFPFALKKQKIDMVHQNLPFNPKGLIREAVINIWCYLFRVPVFLHVHGGIFLMNPPENILYRFLAKQLFKHSKVVVVLSELEKEAIVKFYNYRNTFVLMNSIDSSQFSALSQNKDDALPVLLFIGRIHESKGIEDIIAAFRLLKMELDFRFILCGDGPLRSYCIEECRKILGDDFEYRGVVSGNDKLKAIADSDYFLLPSRYGEGLPMALLETMAAGVVPVVTDDASMKFVVQDKVNGIRVNKHDSLNIRNQLMNVFADSDLYNTLSGNAKKTLSDNYDIKTYIVKLNHMYNFTIS